MTVRRSAVRLRNSSGTERATVAPGTHNRRPPLSNVPRISKDRRRKELLRLKMFALGRALASAGRNACPAVQKCNAHTLPPLPYKYNALEPIICGEIMELHHQKHHATYVANLNAAEENLQAAIAKGDINCIISLQPALKFNGGGHINHSIFWNNLSPCGGQPSEDLLRAVCSSFGSLDDMKNKMMTMTNAIQGSGWGWLGVNPETKKLHLATCANQDPLQGTTGLIPLFGIDVWEHAYYLQYKNARAEYTKKIFDILNWDDINKRFCLACN